MADTESLIAQLSKEVATIKRLSPPSHFIVRLLVVLLVYTLGMQLAGEHRDDILTQLHRPAFAFELFLLTLLTLTSTLAAVLAMYPDAYQRAGLLKLPYVAFASIVLFVLVQSQISPDARMVLPETSHTIECTLSIAALAMIPSAIIFLLLRKGASVHPLQAGIFAVLASSGISSLLIRIAEKNDDLLHLATFHYLPILVFAGLGALAGKWLIKW